MPAETQMLQAAEDRLDVVEAIGDQEEKAPAANLVGDVVQERPHRVFISGLHRHERVEDRLHVAQLAAGRQPVAPVRVEDVESDAVALIDDEIRQGRRQRFREFELVRILVAVEHRVARVHHQMGGEVRFLLVLLDGVAIGTSVAFPVDMANIIARHILAMLDEFDREAAIRTFMIADAQTLDEGACLDA